MLRRSWIEVNLPILEDIVCGISKRVPREYINQEVHDWGKWIE